MLIENAVREIDEWAIRGERMPKLMRARIFRESAFGNRMIWEGVDLLASAGCGGFARYRKSHSTFSEHALATSRTTAGCITDAEPDMIMV